MSFMFPLPTLSEPAPQYPIKLNELSARLGSTSTQKVRTVDEILEVIQQGYSESISPLEWIYCLHTKANWDKDHPEDACKTSKSIWDVAIENPNLAYLLDSLLLYRLALYYSGDKTALSSSLAECFLAFAQRIRSTRSLKIDILEAISSAAPSKDLANLSWQQLLLPQQLLTQASLPSWILPAKDALDDIVHLFIASKNPSNQQVELLLKCLNQMGEEQQIQNVNNLLTQIPTQVGGKIPQLVDWLQKHYRKSELWSMLSSSSKKSLRDWTGAINYTDFENLVNLIIQELPTLNGSTHYRRKDPKKQIINRSEFWSNYSHSFENVRILLPKVSISSIGNRLQSSFESLQSDGSDPTEICIFDIGNWFIAEFFRGRGSETRIFPKNLEIEKQLFDSNQISIKKIRALGGAYHDHAMCWQWSCVNWLRERNIYPNEGIQYFRGLSQEHGRYNVHTGLPEPSEGKKLERKEQVENWGAVIRTLEKEARDFLREK
jgi:hypothetical protein